MKLKKLVKIFAILIFGIYGFILYFSCDIGLGSAVDTEAPVIRITSPETSAVLKGNIEVKGSYQDDKKISRLVINVVNVEKETSSISNAFATVNDNGSWNYSIYTQTSSAVPSGVPVLGDGKYEIKAVGYDEAGHSSGESSRTIEIDTTAPVVALSKPATINFANASPYGRSIKIKGLISDDHSLAGMKVQIFKANSDGSIGEEIQLTKSEFTDFDPSDTSVTIAKFFMENSIPAESSDDYKLYDNWLKIYGNNNGNNPNWNKEVKYFALVTVTDKAGNASERTFLKSNLLSLVQTEAGQILEMADLKNILNGSYKGSLNGEKLENVKSILNGSFEPEASGDIHEYCTSNDSKLVFSVNSNANPTYELSGNYSYNLNADTIADSFRSVEETGSLTFKVDMGLDDIAFRPKNLTVRIFKLSSDNSFETPEQNSTECIELDSSKIKKSNGTDNIASDDTAAESGTYSISLSDIAEFANANNQTSGFMKPGQYYRFEVGGSDDDGNDFIAKDDKNYGFYVSPSTIPCTVTFDQNKKYISAASLKNDPKITVNVKDTAGNSQQISFKAYVKYFENSKEVKLFENNFSDITEAAKNLTFTGNDNDVEIPLNNLPDESIKNYTLAVKVVTKKEYAIETTDIFYLYVDNSAPNISFKNTELLNPAATISVYENASYYKIGSNEAEKSNYFWDESTEKYIVRGLWDDIQTSEEKSFTGSGGIKLYYSIDNFGTTEPANWQEFGTITDADYSIQSSTSWEAEISLSKSEGQGKKQLSFKAEDAVGNESSPITFKNITFDFAEPSLKYSGSTLQTYYKSGDNPLVTFISEDDYGVASISVDVYKGNDNLTSGDNTYKIELADVGADNIYGNKSKKTARISFPQPLSSANDGTYKISATATDSAGRTKSKIAYNNNLVDNLSFIIDATKPLYKADSIKVNEGDWSNSTFYGSETLSISLEFTEAIGMDRLYYWVKNSEADEQWTPVKKTAYFSDSSNVITFTADFTDNNGTKANTLYVQAQDKAGNLSEEESFTINIDKTAPKIKLLKHQFDNGDLLEPVSTLYINGNSSLTLYGSYEDAESGVQALSFAGTKKDDDGNYRQPEISYYAGTFGENDTLSSVTYKEFSKLSDVEKKTSLHWKAVFANGDSGIITTGTLKANGKNNAGSGLKTEVDLFALNKDGKNPELKSVNITSSNENYPIYKVTEESIDYYYLSNKDQAITFTFSGIAEDNSDAENAASGVSKVTLEIEGLAAQNQPEAKSTAFFTGISLKGLTGNKTARLIVYDNAGNQSDPIELNLRFDTEAPVGVHAFDGSSKDLYFRIGEQYRDDGLEKDSEGNVKLDSSGNGTASSGAPAWDSSLDKDVGGKYSIDTYGNSENIKIRGNFDDKGSGISIIYYKVYDSLPDTNGASDAYRTSYFLENYKTIADGSFTPIKASGDKTIEDQAKRRVFYKPVTGGIKNSLGESIPLTGADAGSFNGKNWVNITSTYKTTINGLSLNKANYLVLIAVDNVGNAGIETIKLDDNTTANNYVINVDKQEPVISSSNSSDIIYSNGDGSQALSGSVTDLGSTNAGIKKVEAYATINGEEVKFPVTLKNATSNVLITDSSTREERQNAKWSAEIDTTKFKKEDGTAVSETVTISVRAIDDAGSGNSTSIPAATIIMDTEKPTVTDVKVESGVTEKHEDTVQVNGSVTISGGAKDNKGLKTESGSGDERTKTLEIFYNTDGSDNWTHLAYAVQGATWSYSVNTKQFTDNDYVWFRIAVTDLAGNVGYSDKIKVYVNQDSDRPQITLTSPSDLDMTSGTGIQLWQDKKISGTVEDDDTITYFGYKTDDDSDYTQLSFTNGRWNIQNLPDKELNIYFKVIAGNEYTANTSTVYNEDTKTKTYRLKDDDESPHKYGYYDAEHPTVTTANVLKLKIDTEAPTVDPVEYSFTNGTLSSDWATNLSSQTIGGSYSKLYIRQNAYDSNGIVSMTVKIVEIVNGDTENPTVLEEQTIDSETSHEDRSGKLYQLFKSGEIDVSSYATTFNDSKTATSNAKQLIVIVSDGTNEKETKIDLTVDNTAPVVTFSSPKADSINSGEITVWGTSNELGEKVYYTVSTYGDAEHAPSTDAGKILKKWTGYSIDDNGTKNEIAENNPVLTINDVSVPAYEEIPDAATSFYVYFDGNTSDTKRAHAVQMKNYVKTLGLTNDISSFNYLVNFYLWIKIEDKVGNVAEYPYCVCVDPQGDRPTVEITNPDTDGDTQGGHITLRGSTNGSNGRTVESVWVQILSKRNGSGYGQVLQSDNKITSFTPSVKDLRFWQSLKDSSEQPLYTVQKIDPEKETNNGVTNVKKDSAGNLIHTSLTDLSTDAKEAAFSESPADYAIKATLNSSGTAWSLKINSMQEFDPSDAEANEVAIRVYACDNTGNVSYSVSRYLKIDNDTPIFSDVYLKQYEDDDSTKAEIKSQLLSSTGTYVKGKWFISFTVTDDVEMGDISITDNSSGSPVEIPITAAYITDSSDIKSKSVVYPLNTNNGVGSLNFTINASDKTEHTGHHEVTVNYDNEAPKLLLDNKSGFEISSEIRQSSGFYKLSSKVSDASSTGNPSGVKAVGFYFMRRDSSGKGSIYDLMQVRANPISTDNLEYKDGLYWIGGKVAVSSTGITIKGGLASNKAYVHSGSYIRIDGVMYKIGSVNDTTITLDENTQLGETSSDKDAYIALALFVDNRKSEYGEGDSFDANGYYSSVKNDDGDQMEEEMGGTSVVSTWTASVVSRNIPDGPIEIHYTAYDAAMNYALGIIGNKDWNTYKAYTTEEAVEAASFTASAEGDYNSLLYTYDSNSPAYIKNNAPRLSAVTVAVNYDGGSDYDKATKYTSYYRTDKRLINGEAVEKAIDVTDSLTVAESVKDSDGNVTGYKGFTILKGHTRIVPELVGGNGKLFYDYKIYASDENGKKTGSAKKTMPVSADTYFADGQDDYDTYTKKTAGQTYVEAHEAKKDSAVGAIEHEVSFLETLDNSTVERPTWFEYTIYDSTEGETAWDNNQKATIKVALAVQVKDDTKPNVVIEPFSWSSLTNNSIYGSSAATSLSDLQGHIELKSDWLNASGYTGAESGIGDDDPKVSGKIVISGYAYDNIRLASLSVSIPKSEVLKEPITLAVFKDSQWYDSSSATIPEGLGVTKGTIDGDSAAGWYFTVSSAEDDGAYSNRDGHKVKWSLCYDTSKVTGIAAEDVSVKVTAIDAAGKSSADRAASEDNNDETKHRPAYKMDVVPYITSVETSLSSLKMNNPSVFARTALGHYSIRAGETVTLKGFNLGTGYEINNTASMTSGEFTYSVNGVSVLNNKNFDDSKGSYPGSVNLTNNPTGVYSIYSNYYNRQPNNDNNNLLTDDIYFDIWELHSDAAVPISGKIEQPVMKINPKTGQLGFAFVNGPLYFSMGGASDHGDTSYDYWMASFDFFTSVGFAYDSLGYSYGVAAGGDINSGAADKFQLMTSRWGHAGRFQHGSYSGLNYIDSSRPASSSLRLESIAMTGTKADTSSNTKNFDKQRIKSPSFATSVHGTGDTAVTNLYLAYYDALNDEIRFKAGDSDHFNGFDVTINETDKYYQITHFDNGGVNNQNKFAHYNPTIAGKLNNDTYVTLYDKDKTTPINPGKVYKVQGAGDDENDATNSWFRLEEVNIDVYKNNFNESLKSTDLGYYPAAQDLYDMDKTETYVRVCTISGKSLTSSFIDYDVSTGLYKYRHQTVSMLAGSTTGTGQNAGEYVSIGVIPGSTAENDVVVAVWYDATNRVLRYAYNTSPMTNRNGTTNGGGWTYATDPVFTSSDYGNNGEYCQLAVDANGGIHIAAYDGSHCDLLYAYLPSYDAEPQTCVVDSNGVVGSNITIDVALDANGNAIPRIGYYATSCIRPKLAYLADTSSQNPTGVSDDAFTGKWECSVIPTSSNVTLQSNQYNKMNVALWKDSSGVISRADSTAFSAYGNTSANNTYTNNSNGYNSVSYGFAYGNGSSNAIMGYAIKMDATTDHIETAQMR